jgi:hypothetical protein
MPVSGVVSNGSSESVDRAQAELELSLNKNAVKQMELMEKQANSQLIQTNLSHRTDLMNSAKQTSTKIQM